MNSQSITKGIVQAFLIIVLLFAVYEFLVAVESVIVYILVAAVVSLIGRPITLFLKRIKFGNTIATITTLAILLGVFMGIVSLLIPVLVEQAKNLSLLNVKALESTAISLLQELEMYLGRYDISMLEWINRAIEAFDYSLLPETFNGIVRTLGGWTIGLFSVLFITFFFLKDSKLLEQIVLVFVNDKQVQRVEKSMERIKGLLSRYFIGLLFQISILFVFYTLVLAIFGIPNAVTIAFICALLNLIPYLGPFIGGVLMIFLTMTSNLGADFAQEILPKTLYVFIGFFIGQMIDNFLSQPLIFSNSVQSHPLEIFIIIVVGGLLGGPIGMIIAVPFYTSLKVVFKEFYAHNKIVKALTKNI